MSEDHNILWFGLFRGQNNLMNFFESAEFPRKYAQNQGQGRITAIRSTHSRRDFSGVRRAPGGGVIEVERIGHRDGERPASVPGEQRSGSRGRQGVEARYLPHRIPPGAPRAVYNGVYGAAVHFATVGQSRAVGSEVGVRVGQACLGFVGQQCNRVGHGHKVPNSRGLGAFVRQACVSDSNAIAVRAVRTVGGQLANSWRYGQYDKKGIITKPPYDPPKGGCEVADFERCM